MTTPKRYEEMAEALLTGLGYRRAVRFSHLDMRDTTEALRTAARQAQVRALDEALNILSLAPSLDEAFKATTELRARLDSGEDL